MNRAAHQSTRHHVRSLIKRVTEGFVAAGKKEGGTKPHHRNQDGADQRPRGRNEQLKDAFRQAIPENDDQDANEYRYEDRH